MTTRQITLERTYDAPIDVIWDLWTTKDGIESWWGPDGFYVTVRSIDLRPGGVMKYGMTASAPEQVAFMEAHGMPLTTETSIRYAEVGRPTRLAYQNVVDFVPGVDMYEVGTVVELHATASGTRLVLIIDAMHDDTWTGRAVMGWEMELTKLANVLAK